MFLLGGVVRFFLDRYWLRDIVDDHFHGLVEDSM